MDAAGELLAYLTMDNLRVFSRRHALRKAYTSAVMGRDSGAHAAGLHAQGRNIADLGDPRFTHGQGGLVIMQDGPSSWAASAWAATPAARPTRICPASAWKP